MGKESYLGACSEVKDEKVEVDGEGGVEINVKNERGVGWLKEETSVNESVGDSIGDSDDEGGLGNLINELAG